MADAVTIQTILASLRAASEIAKLVRDSSTTLERAEVNLKLADLLGKIADARIQVAELQEAILAKDGRIAELEEALQTREEVVKHRDAYYRKDASGNARGDAFCPACWEAKHKLHTLVDTPIRHVRQCLTCNSTFAATQTPSIP